MKTYIADAIRGNLVTGISFDARDADHAGLICKTHGWDLIDEVDECIEEEVIALIEAHFNTLH
jgi:hypothetical protein